MSSSVLKSRAEIPLREWVEFEIRLGADGKITSAEWWASGCNDLLVASAKAAEIMKGHLLSELKWSGTEHWNLLVSEAVLRLQNRFQPPVTDEELCHCRKIPAVKVDQAIVLGAHTPEVVRAWTTASSGCGTCRPEVEKLIQFRLKK